jgi:diguanylate cyclase (GGDEF)-like protein
VINDPAIEPRSGQRSELEATARAEAATPPHPTDVDPVTGLYNSRGLFLALDREIARLRRSGHSLSMIVTTIDGFSDLAQQYGKNWAHGVLKAIARKLRDQSREYDVLARTDADEFVMVLPEFPVKYMEGRIERLEQGAAAAAAEVISDRLCFSTVFANCPEHGEDAESLLALTAARLHERRQARATADPAVSSSSSR